MRNKINRLMSFVLTVCFLFSVCGVGKLDVVQAMTTTNCVPITCYTIKTGKVITYDYDEDNGNGNGTYSYSGYIDGRLDKCVIQKIKEDGYCEVRYPVGNGYKTAYVQSEEFFLMFISRKKQ